MATPCSTHMSEILHVKAVLFNHEDQEYKLITYTLHITKNAAVQIIQKYSTCNDKKISG